MYADLHLTTFNKVPPSDDLPVVRRSVELSLVGTDVTARADVDTLVVSNLLFARPCLALLAPLRGKVEARDLDTVMALLALSEGGGAENSKELLLRW